MSAIRFATLASKPISRSSIFTPSSLSSTRRTFATRLSSSSRFTAELHQHRSLSTSTSTISSHARTMATKPQAGGPLTDGIKEDHEEMYDYYDKYTQASSKGDKDAATRWANQLMWEVARHAVGEEIVVYPLMEHHLGEEGKKLANEDRDDHQLVKQKLYDLSSLTAGNADYDALLKEVMDHLHKHNDSEEQNDLPLLEPKLGADGSKKAAADFKRTKKFAPTRPHPSAPNQPPLETFAGFLSAPLDKLMDAFKKFPTDEMKKGN